ncbi:MAG: DNA polymerase III subunit gamma/tau [Chitinophagales bacterium]|nr:DNA polymerase III subunit gamma/tau [Chitinophagales bacterium]MDW8427448.1 DNA polymerase III subunit gamma/tau [Chitinophagales bacterium]
MEGFLVSARKYRPIRFADVVGQPQVTLTLKNALVNGKVAQAYLFCGPRGVGKTTCARILAMAVNCEQPVEQGEPCNQCASCTSFIANTSLNIFELDAASNNSVDDIRSLIEQVRYAPQYGKKKIYIIDEVHMLSQQAFNAFLKTLEEPPPHAIFILATTEKHRIIPTILSRCQIFDFHRITVADMVAQLAAIADKEHIEAEPEALHLIAHKADGALRDALSLFDRMTVFGQGRLRYADVAEVLHVLDHDQYFQLTDNLLSGDAAAALLQVNEIFQRGFEPAYLLQGLAEHFRDLLVARDPATRTLLQCSPTIQQRYGEQAELTPLSFLLTALSLTADAEYQLRDSRNKRLLVELLILRLCYLQYAHPVNKESDKKADAQKKNDVPQLKLPSETPSSNADLVSQQKTPRSAANKPAQEPQPSSPSSLLTLEQLRQQAAQTAKVQAPNPLPDDDQEPIDPPSFATAHQNLLAYLQTESLDSLAKILDAFPARIADQNTVLFTVGNSVHANAIRSEMERIRRYLCEQLGRRSLRIRLEIDQQVSTPKMPFSPEEKFAYLAERYPLLYKLKNDLKLELDY